MTAAADRPDLFTLTDGARVVGRSPRTLERWRAAGWLRPAARDRRDRELFTLAGLADAHYRATDRVEVMRRRLSARTR